MQQIDLNGPWKLRWRESGRGRLAPAEADEFDPSGAIDARVPGDVHMDFLRSGLIADPYEGTHALCCRWVEECQFAYRKEFDAPADALAASDAPAQDPPKRGRAWLVFEGLDLTARVVLNGREVGRHDNAFYPCRLDVTGRLRAGKNVLAVYLESGLHRAADEPGGGYAPGRGTPLVKRHRMRKAQFQGGLDWATRLLNVGIHKPVRLEWTTEAARVEELVPIITLGDDFQTATVRARVWVEGLQGQGRPARGGELVAEMVDTGEKASARVEIKPGLHPYEVTVEVADPQLWWPAGHGAQILYWLRVTLHVDPRPAQSPNQTTALVSTRPGANVPPRGKEIGEAAARIGFRRIRFDQDPNPRGGRNFLLEVNGKKVFAKGANWSPFDMILANQDSVRMGHLIDRALDLHFNFLRLSGVGEYGGDEFYTLCDKKGLMVWQEFPFSHATYPTGDAAFFEDVKREAAHNVRRLAKFPSLIAWCGNNGQEYDAWERGTDESGGGNGGRADGGAPEAPADYALYHLTLPKTLAREDPGRHYQPSSPWSPDGLPPGADEAGTQHPWAVGRGGHDFRKYRQMACRFPLEGGFLGPPSLPTMLACLPPGHGAIHSFAWDVHDNALANADRESSRDGPPDDSPGAPPAPDAALAEHLGRDMRTMSVEDYAYFGGLLQGEALREYCDNFRRRMFDPSGGAVFWMFNDVWPAVRSWSVIDYHLRRTPGFYAVRRSFAPLHLVVTLEGGSVSIYGINETPKTVGGDLRFGFFNPSGSFPMNRLVRVNLPPNTSAPLATFPAEKWKAAEGAIAFAELSRHERTLARNRLVLPLFKHLPWAAVAPGDVRVRVEKDRAVFECDAFAWGVCIDLGGETPLADNFFDVWPGIPYSIPWTDAQGPRVLRVGNLTGSAAPGRAKA